MKVLNTSDWHFQEKDHDEILKCCEFILEFAKKNKPDLIVHSGDITHSEHLKLDTKSAKSIFRLFKAFSDIAPVAVITGTKSHDGKASMALSSISGKYPILVSDYPGQFGYYDAITTNGEWFEINQIVEMYPKFIITQIPQPTKQYFVNDMAIEDSEKALSGALTGMFVNFGGTACKFNCPHVVNMHIQVGGCYISETQQLIGRDIEASKYQLKMLNADVICLGHIHLAHQIAENAFYPGSPTRMNHGETETKGFRIHEITPAACEMAFTDNTSEYHLESEFIETPARKMLSIKEDFTRDGYPISEIDIALYTYSPEELKNAHIKVVLTIWQDESKHINQSDIEKFYFSGGAESVKISILRKPREIVRSIKVCEAETLRKKFRAMSELRGEEITESVLFKAGSLDTEIVDYVKKYDQIVKMPTAKEYFGEKGLDSLEKLNPGIKEIHK